MATQSGDRSTASRTGTAEQDRRVLGLHTPLLRGRLEARPVATLCVEAQERRELAERQFRDREDQYR